MRITLEFQVQPRRRLWDGPHHSHFQKFRKNAIYAAPLGEQVLQFRVGRRVNFS